MLPARSEPKQIARYQILESLPARGKVRVFHAIEQDSQRHVVLRTVPKDLNDPEAMSEIGRLKKLADIGTRLKHPGIVEVFEYGEEGATAYLALEFVEGCNLHSRLRVPIADAATMAVQLLGALEYAHAQRVLHLNLNPAHLVLTSKGQIKLTDFGGPEQGEPDSPYRSPEQVSGMKIDSRSDLFSAGVLFYGLLASAPAFPGPVEELTDQICRRPEVPVSRVKQSVPPVFDAVCSKALAKSPKDRYATAREFCDCVRAAYQEALGGLPKDLVSNETAVSAFLASLRSDSKKTRTKQTVAKSEPKAPPESLKSNFDPHVLRTVEKKLAPFLGPLARIVVKEAGSKATDLDQLYELAADSLSNTDRAAFLRGHSPGTPIESAAGATSDRIETATTTFLEMPARGPAAQPTPPKPIPPKSFPSPPVKTPSPVKVPPSQDSVQSPRVDLKPVVPEMPKNDVAKSGNVGRLDAARVPSPNPEPHPDIVARLEDLLGKQPENLAGYLAEEPPELDQVIHAFIASADALVRLYDANGMTFGLTPQNIVFDRIGNASIRTSSATSVGRTMLGSPMGSPRYAAPEILADTTGTPPGSAAAVDIYALGMMFYEILLGRKLFRTVLPNKTELDWLRWHADASKKAPTLKTQLPDQPNPLSELLESMLEKDVSKRAKDPALILMRLKSIAQQASRTLVGPRPRKAAASEPSGDDLRSAPRQKAGLSALTIVSIILGILLLLGAAIIAMRFKALWLRAPNHSSGAIVCSALKHKEV